MALGTEPGTTTLLVILARVSASDAVASSARWVSGVRKGLDLAIAELRSGCGEGSSELSGLEAAGEVLTPRGSLGEDDMVVTVVVAVRGRSVVPEDGFAPKKLGSFPVNSNFRILDFRSSSSSHTVDGAVVDTVDSVPSKPGKGGDDSCSKESFLAVNGED